MLRNKKHYIGFHSGCLSMLDRRLLCPYEKLNQFSALLVCLLILRGSSGAWLQVMVVELSIMIPLND